MRISTFWMMHRNIDRLQAEDDLRTINLLGSAHTGDGITKVIDQLQKQLGTVVKVDEGKAAIKHAKLDRSGLEKLRRISRGVRP